MAISFFSVKNIDELDFNKLVRQLPRVSGRKASVRRAYVRAILESYDVLLRYEVNTPKRLAHFLGQGLVETGWLGSRVEDLNHDASGLVRVFGRRRFPTDQVAREYAGQPERIANYVYGGRDDLGNGPPESGDGWRYRGRGFFQLTGRANYREYGALAGLDLENDPELIERDLMKSVEVAAAYFHHKRLGVYADQDDARRVSRGVNRGNPNDERPALDEAGRIEWTNRALDLVRDPQALLQRASTETVLRSGAVSERARSLQQWLAELRYPVGPVDGIFGPATERALILFQREHGLPMTGVLDQPTEAAINLALNGGVEPPAADPSAQTPIGAPQAVDPSSSPAPQETGAEASPAPDSAAPVVTSPELEAAAPNAVPAEAYEQSTPTGEVASAPPEAVPDGAPSVIAGATPDAAPEAPDPEVANSGNGALKQAPSPGPVTPPAATPATEQPSQTPG